MSRSTRPPPRRRTSRSASRSACRPKGPYGVCAYPGCSTSRREGNIGGATLAAFDLRTAQQLFDKEGRLDQIRAAAAEGTTRGGAALRRSSPMLPPGTQVRTGDGQADEDASETQSFLSFLQGFLLAFGGIALFVGAFVIANSLSITIAQRTREFATLRTIGASRRQIMRAVLIEALVVGLRRLGRRHRARPRPRQGPLLAVRAGRVHAAEQRPAPADADGDRRADRRRARNRHRQPASRSPRDARASDRRRPRGCGAAAGRFARYRPVGSALLGLAGFALLAYGLFGPGLSTYAAARWPWAWAPC